MSNLAFSKANRIISILVKTGVPMHVEDLAEESGLRRNSLEKLIGLLSHHEWVTKSDDLISIGPMLRDLGLSVLSLDSLPLRAEPFMTKLFEKTGVDAALCIYTAPTVVFVKKVGFTNHPNSPGIGMPYDAHVMAVGRSILACFSQAYLHDYIGTFLADQSAEWIERKVLGPIEETRSRGFGMTTADRIGHVEAICAPVFSVNGDAVGAINLWRPCEDISDAPTDSMMDYVPALLEAAEQISQAMGAPRAAA